MYGVPGTRYSATRTRHAERSPSPDPRQRRANELGRRHPFRAAVEHAAHGLLGVRGRVPERDERADRIVRSGPSAASDARRHARALELVELVGQVEDELLGLLAPDARHALQRGDVLLPDGTHVALGRERREQTERERGPDSLRAENLLDHAALVWRGEAEQLPAVLLHDEMRVHGAALARFRQCLVRVERHGELVGDTAVRQDLDAIQLFRDQRSGNLGDHEWRVLGGGDSRDAASRGRDGSRTRPPPSMRGRDAPITHASAAATPSAASDGCGTLLSRSRRVSMNCTCSFVAPPVPTTAFLISAGAISFTGTFASSAASRITPRAWPSTTVVRTLRA